jgi:hypothetical protein
MNNTIPMSRFDPIAVQLLQHYPLPNVSGANNFVRTATEPDDQDQADFRLDRYFGEKHRVFEVDPIVWTKFWPSLDGGAG